jgi:hypothetical protein
VEVTSSVAMVTGHTAICSLEIPLSWKVNDPRNGVALNYQIGAPHPPAGGTSNLRLNLTL